MSPLEKVLGGSDSDSDESEGLAGYASPHELDVAKRILAAVKADDASALADALCALGHDDEPATAVVTRRKPALSIVLGDGD